MMADEISGRLREAAELARARGVPAEDAEKELRKQFAALEKAEDERELCVFRIFYHTLFGQEFADVIAVDTDDARRVFFEGRIPELYRIFRISGLGGKEECYGCGDRCGECRPSNGAEGADEHFSKQVFPQRGDVKKLPIRHGFLPAAPMNGQTRLRRVRERVEHLLNRFVG